MADMLAIELAAPLAVAGILAGIGYFVLGLRSERPAAVRFFFRSAVAYLLGGIGLGVVIQAIVG